MANRRVTVVNPAGYQEQLPDTDNLQLAAAPTANTHGTNKLYVDTTVSDAVANIDLSAINQELDDLEDDIAALALRVSAIENTYATKTYVDTQDQSLQDQIDAIIAQGEIQNLDDVLKQGNSSTLGATFGGTVTANKFVGDGSDLTNLPIPPAPTLQSVTDSGDTTDNDMTSTGTITADVLVGDIDQGEY